MTSDVPNVSGNHLEGDKAEGPAKKLSVMDRCGLGLIIFWLGVLGAALLWELVSSLFR